MNVQQMIVSGLLRGLISLVVFAQLFSPTPGPVGAAGLPIPEILKDINPGAAGSGPNGFMQVAPNRICFVANDGPHPAGLWATNGTPEGTALVKDLALGTSSGTPIAVAGVTKGKAFFFAYNNGKIQLWVTDCTTAGTQMISDNGGVGFDFEGYFPYTATAAGKLIFINYFQKDNELWGDMWVSDGTPEGTFILNYTQAYRMPESVVASGDLFFFNDPYNGFYTTDGSPGGTRLIDSDGKTVVNAYAFPGSPGSLLISRGVSIYAGYEMDVFKVDATGASVKLAKEGGGKSYEIYKVVQSGDLVYFMIRTWSLGPYYSFSLWRTDGTPSGTIEIINANANTQNGDVIIRTFVVGNTVYFTIPDHTKLYRTDGTLEGTVIIDTCESCTSLELHTAPLPIGGVQGILMYKKDILGDNASSHTDLFSTTGTAESVQLVASVLLSPEKIYEDSPGMAYRGRLYFRLSNGSGYAFFGTDGSTAEQLAVYDQVGDAYALVGGRLVFVATDPASGSELRFLYDPFLNVIHLPMVVQ